ncbi:hypothetical protein J3R73_000179 [Labrys monachus]|uniref:Photosystem II phosphoprotein n=1 Tax=Labrys monachus TaxID=217067 RepID=A0ABU0F6Z7_9HYPH|nr:hypothetical protein [Labrys monachus]
MSATSSLATMARQPQPGGTTSSVNRSSGLIVLRIRTLETFV